jgi:hypothetical protein
MPRACALLMKDIDHSVTNAALSRRTVLGCGAPDSSDRRSPTKCLTSHLLEQSVVKVPRRAKSLAWQCRARAAQGATREHTGSIRPR